MFNDVDIRYLAIPFVSQDENPIELSVGDLHANLMLMIYILHRYGAIDIAQSDYTEMFDIYNFLAITPWNDKKQIMPQVHRLLELLRSLRFCNTLVSFRFIGDELADRGACDLFIIELLRLMHLNQIQYKILLSNHGLCFIEAFIALKTIEQIVQDFRMIESSAMKSFWNLKTLSDWGEVNLASINLILEDVYYPFIKLIDTAFDWQSETVHIYSHAAIGLNDLRQLALEFECQWQDANLFQIGKSMHSIQTFFHNEKMPYLKKLFELSAQLNLEGRIHSDIMLLKQSRLSKVCWNREYAADVIYRPDSNHGYHVKYVYGHDSSDENVHAHCICLDGLLGKLAQHCKTGEYKVLTSAPLMVIEQNVVSYEHRFATGEYEVFTSAPLIDIEQNEVNGEQAFAENYQTSEYKVLPSTPTRGIDEDEVNGEQAFVDNHQTSECKALPSAPLKAIEKDKLSYKPFFPKKDSSSALIKPFQFSWTSILPYLSLFAFGFYFKQQAKDGLPLPRLHVYLQQMIGNLLGSTHILSQEMFKRR